jgi:beta-lactamase class A
VRTALLDPDPANRRVTLPLLAAEAQGRNINDLHEMILRLAANMGFAYNGPNTLLSVYVMDLQTGDEVRILSDVPHSAVSVIKIPIMINLFRKELIVSQDEAFLLAESILCSNNSASNFLIQVVGLGDAMQSQMGDGLNQISCAAQKLGAEHTFINAPLWVGDSAYEFSATVCQSSAPANRSYDTRPDQFSQTTAEDMGRLLVGIYDCARSASGLMAVYPDDINQAECQQMINLLSGNRIDRLIELGVPPGTRVAHKNGWAFETSADAAIVFSPGGDYVLSVFNWEVNSDNNTVPTILSWEVIEEISRATYNYFNPGAPLLQRRTPINPLTAIDCVSYRSPDDVNLNDINANRLDANGDPLPTACYGGSGDCRTFVGWGAE